MFEFPDDDHYFLAPIQESRKEELDVSIDKRQKVNKNWGKLKKYIHTMTRLKRNDAKKLEVAVSDRRLIIIYRRVILLERSMSFKRRNKKQNSRMDVAK